MEIKLNQDEMWERLITLSKYFNFLFIIFTAVVQAKDRRSLATKSSPGTDICLIITALNYVPLVDTKIHYGSLLKMSQISFSESGMLWTTACRSTSSCYCPSSSTLPISTLWWNCLQQCPWCSVLWFLKGRLCFSNSAVGTGHWEGRIHALQQVKRVFYWIRFMGRSPSFPLRISYQFPWVR